jgi:hypothetical protein
MDSATIARVSARGALIPMFVVSGNASHELLTIRELAGINLSQEVAGLLAA